ncbi:uncharacterized protein LOC117643789 [Thrips palmi]|uniref:Uncharacterized protein LOC117643789 n=1 Tax=Thrips palmi TaxID=161013 RepID=A0A6P8YX47_THRPL|nr:uncharacterized protein LOC117643789 [Thrips palmi]
MGCTRVFQFASAAAVSRFELSTVALRGKAVDAGLILPNDPRGRRLLVCTGGLRRLQEIPAEPGSAIAESVAVINCCFPKEIVRYYSPGFPDTLLDLIEDFDPLAPVQREWPDPAPRSVAATASATSTATMLGKLVHISQKD